MARPPPPILFSDALFYHLTSRADVFASLIEFLREIGVVVTCCWLFVRDSHTCTTRNLLAIANGNGKWEWKGPLKLPACTC